ncbi:hypothetical protein GCK32_022309 [Trichostrongylus colubriformis]|uniref:Uncharacterized protein n=1 Tax=Trichostrongylus colubriformis TaxID=6319 RepID=A0AAN8IIM5_TRICO
MIPATSESFSWSGAANYTYTAVMLNATIFVQETKNIRLDHVSMERDEEEEEEPPAEVVSKTPETSKGITEPTSRSKEASARDDFKESSAEKNSSEKPGGPEPKEEEDNEADEATLPKEYPNFNIGKKLGEQEKQDSKEDSKEKQAP